MKTLAYIIVLFSAYSTVQATKYVCTQNNLEDSDFTTVFNTEEECRKWCGGIGSVCQETEDSTDVSSFGPQSVD